MSNWKAMLLTWRMQQTIAYNGLVYNINQFWFFKKFSFELFYKESDLKWLFGIVLTVLAVVPKLMLRSVLFLALVGFSHMLSHISEVVLSREQIYLQFLIVSVLLWRVVLAIEGLATSSDIGTYETIQFQLPVKSVVIARNMTFFLKSCLEAWVFSWFIKEVTVFELIGFFGLSVALRLIIQVASIALYRMTDKSPLKRNVWALSGAAILGILVTVLQFIGVLPNSVPFFFSSYHIFTSLILFGIGLMWVYHHQTLERFIRLMSYQHRQQAKGQVNGESVEIASYQLSDDVVSKGSVPIGKRSGIAYLNAVFYERLKPVFHKNMRWLVGVAVVLVSLSLLGMQFFGAKELLREQIGNVYRVIGTFFMASFFIYQGFSGYFVKLYFVQMDSAFLKYTYYRQPKVVHELLVCRLKHLLMISLPVYVILNGFAFVVCVLWGQMSAVDYLFVVLCHSVFMLFWNLHALYLYFAFQPYTKGLKAKSVAFQLITGGTYVLGFNFSKVIGQLSQQGVIILLACLVVYIMVGYVVVYKRAPKYFVLK